MAQLGADESSLVREGASSNPNARVALLEQLAKSGEFAVRCGVAETQTHRRTYLNNCPEIEITLCANQSLPGPMGSGRRSYLISLAKLPAEGQVFRPKLFFGRQKPTA